MSDISLVVGGREYAGWKSARVVIGIESVASGFSLEVSERWEGQPNPWPIAEEEECSLLMGTETLITGWVDRRSPAFDANSHTLTVTGRSKPGILVDCSALLDQWEFRKTSVLAFVQKVCAPYGIDVSLQPGLVLGPAPAKISVTPGEKAFAAISRVCHLAGVLPVSTGAGALVLTRVGTGRCTTALIQGSNVLSGSGEYDATERFRDYLVMGQHQGSDWFNGASAAGIAARAEDQNVKRVARTLVIRPEGSTTRAQAQTRAEWEATVRAAKAEAFSLTVQGWRQGDGTRWPVNALVGTKAPALGVDGDLLITQAEYSAGPSGTTTTLTLRRPDAFKPEPKITTTGTGGLWKEIAGGV